MSLVFAEVYGFAHALHLVVANQLSSLLPSHAKDWWPMIEDVFSSPQVRGLRERLLQECIANEEFQCINIAATMRCCLPILGQARIKSSAEARAQRLPSRRVCHCEEYLGCLYFSLYQSMYSPKLMDARYAFVASSLGFHRSQPHQRSASNESR